MTESSQILKKTAADSFNAVLSDNTAPIRWLLAVLMGISATALLAWSMHYLIHSGDRMLDDALPAYYVDFVRIQREEHIKINTPKPKKPPQPKKPPAEPPIPKLSSPTPKAQKMQIKPSTVKTDIALDATGFSLNLGDSGEYLPIAKVAPMYPRRAARKGIEGHCTVVYTVKTDGTVKNVQAIESECTHSSFKKPSINAAKQFRYKPRVSDGVSMEVPNVRNKFIYQLEKIRRRQ